MTICRLRTICPRLLIWPSPYNPFTAPPEVADATARAREVFESPEAAEQLARALSSIPKDTSQPEYAVEPRFAELVEDAADHQRQQEEARQRRAVYQRLAMQDSSASSQPVPPPKPSSAVTAGSTAEPAASSSVTLIPRSRSPAARRLVSFPLRNTSRNPRPDMSRIEDSIVNVYEASDAVWLDPWNARYSQSIAVNPGAEIHELDLDSESNDERVAVEHRRRKIEGHIEEAADLNWRAIPGAAVLHLLPEAQLLPQQSRHPQIRLPLRARIPQQPRKSHQRRHELCINQFLREILGVLGHNCRPLQKFVCFREIRLKPLRQPVNIKQSPLKGPRSRSNRASRGKTSLLVLRQFRKQVKHKPLSMSRERPAPSRTQSPWGRQVRRQSVPHLIRVKAPPFRQKGTLLIRLSQQGQ